MNFILKGTICYSQTPQALRVSEKSYLVCEDGVSRGVFSQIPEQYAAFPVTDYGDCLIIPGLCDLHIHAPQFPIRGLGADMELLEWLTRCAFVEEAEYADLDYADKAYDAFVAELRQGATTRACVFATLHVPATVLLMEKLEQSGCVTQVGKVSMDQYSPDNLREADPQAALAAARAWIEKTKGKFRNTTPIVTPRFAPSCSAALMQGLSALQKEYALPVQSHLSENQDEVALVRKMYPEAASYAEVYDRFGLLGGAGMPTVMAHCVWLGEAEKDLLKVRDVTIAHCPQSNSNMSSGIAPVRRLLDKGLRVGLASDVAGGNHTSIFRAMSDAIRVSKHYRKWIDPASASLTEREVFYLGTLGGGRFFGKVGSFEDGYEFDAIVLDDSALAAPRTLTAESRLLRMMHLYENCVIRGKYVRGKRLF